MNTKKRTLLFIFSVLLAALLLVACGGTDETQEGGGMADLTPLATEEFPTDLTGTDVGIETTPIVTEAATMEVEETAAIDTTPMVTGTSSIEPAGTATTEATGMTEPAMTEEATVAPVGTSVVTGTTEMTATNVILAGDFIGMNIENTVGEDVGEISEVLVNMDGEIRYIIFDAGGFLGVDERTTAVTWESFDASLPKDDEDDPLAERVIIFQDEAVDLEVAPELDMADLDAEGFVLDAEDIGLKVTGDVTATQLLQLSEFSGVLDNDFNLVNLEGKDLGEVEDVLIDLTDGRLIYAVVDFGGFLGLAETTVAVPWERLEFDEVNEAFVLDVTDVDLENAPVLDLNTITDEDLMKPDWDADIRAFWEDVTP